MLVKQVSVFLENKSGRLAEVSRALGERGIDISALSIADTTEFGILRLIVNKPDEAVEALKASGFS
ncbi:MAG: ACT domain-containing protein, partial [Clostridia bacterium]|nr:ACT domain-containing protein [Clostridia bacterium]